MGNAAMPRSSAADHRRLEVGMGDRTGERLLPSGRVAPTPTGDSLIAKPRLPSARMRVISAIDRHIVEVDLGDRASGDRCGRHEVHRPAVPALADARQQVASARAGGLHERTDEERRVEELDVDALGVAEREARRGIVERIAGSAALCRSG